MIWPVLTALLGHLQSAVAGGMGGPQAPAWGLDPTSVQAVASLLTLFALVIAAVEIGMTRGQIRDSQLAAGADEPVRLAHDINRLKVELRKEALTAGQEDTLREMYFDLADVISEARRTAGSVMDFAGWEKYFADWLADDEEGSERFEALNRAEGWYTDQMFALFGRLYVRDPASLEIEQRILVARPPDPAARPDAEDRHPPSSLGRWHFHTADRQWNPESSQPFARATLGLRRGRTAGAVRIIWGPRYSESVKTAIRSWIAWHLVEGGIRFTRWTEVRRDDATRAIRVTDFHWRVAEIAQARRRWMDGGSPRFEVPLYVLRGARRWFPHMWHRTFIHALAVTPRAVWHGRGRTS